jgi:hypothetical protein
VGHLDVEQDDIDLIVLQECQGVMSITDAGDDLLISLFEDDFL